MRSTMVFTLALSLLVGAGTASAQTPAQPERTSRFALVPQISAGTVGHRWETESGDMKLGYGRKPMFGTALQIKLPGRLTGELLGMMTSTDYMLDEIINESHLETRGVGQVRLFRVGAGVQYRIREDVPGYFTVGGGALYYQPVTRIFMAPPTEGEEPLDRFSDEVQWMPAGHIGAGIDFDVEGRGVRLDGRFYGSRPSQDRVRDNRTTSSGERFLEARELIVDFVISLGVIFPF